MHDVLFCCMRHCHMVVYALCICNPFAHALRFYKSCFRKFWNHASQKVVFHCTFSFSCPVKSNHFRFLRQGSLLLPLGPISGNCVQPWGPRPLFESKKDLTALVSLPEFHYDVVFPHVSYGANKFVSDFLQEIARWICLLMQNLKNININSTAIKCASFQSKQSELQNFMFKWVLRKMQA